MSEMSATFRKTMDTTCSRGRPKSNGGARMGRNSGPVAEIAMAIADGRAFPAKPTSARTKRFAAPYGAK